MCGICFICSLAPEPEAGKCPFLDMGYIQSNSFLPQRGPDIHKSAVCTLWSKFQAIFAGFVLHFRGSMTPQPVMNDNGDMLLWNGEIFGGIEVKEGENDTQVLFDHLVRCSNQQEILTIVQAVQGPWAFVFWQSSQGRLWFGRDVFGRRSLLWHLPQGADDLFALSSVPVQPLAYEEVPSVGVFCLEKCGWDVAHTDTVVETGGQAKADSDPCQGGSFLTLHIFPWERARWPGTDQEVLSTDALTAAQKLHLDQNQYMTVAVHPDQAVPSWMPVLNREVPGDGHVLNMEDCGPEGEGQIRALEEMEQKGQLTMLVRQLQEVLQKAVVKRVHSVPRSAHSGQDSDLHVKPAVANSHNSVVCDSPALLSTAADHPQLEVGQDTVHEPCSHLYPMQQKEAAAVDKPVLVQCDNHSGGDSSQPPDLHTLSTAEQSGDEGWSDHPQRDADCGQRTVDCVQTSPARIAVLFSGGLDSTVLAVLADRCVPPEEPIDLINVAFQQVSAPQPNRKKAGQHHPTASTSLSYNVPDRQTGYLALSELNSQRHWNFVEVNITVQQLQEERSSHICHLVYPLNTVLDDSIGCAVWFAARSTGILGNGPNRGLPYTSTARVLLCGMGADEQMAGYSRHRVRFQQESWKGLTSEIDMEIHRISARNLGRDDRIIADHGKESRFPFLDEDVVSFLAALPTHHKADLRLPRGIGEKLLLRLLAMHLGLPTTAAQPKRAIQFGSRIAKLEHSKEKGNQVCQRLLQQ